MGTPNLRKLLAPLEQGKTREEYFLEEIEYQHGINSSNITENYDEYLTLYMNLERKYVYHDFKKSDETFQNRVWYVMITSSRQCYGGPEEGGWYYQQEQFVKWCAVPSRQLALAIVAEHNMMKQSYNEGNWEALGGDDTVSSSYPEGYIPSGFVFRNDNYAEVCAMPCLYHQEKPHYE